jgi:hypothetical protein
VKCKIDADGNALSGSPHPQLYAKSADINFNQTSRRRSAAGSGLFALQVLRLIHRIKRGLG